MPTRSIALTDRQNELVASLVQSGRYNDAEDVVGEALDLLADQEAAEDGTKLARLRADVQVGIDAIARGEYQDFESVDDFVAYLERLGDDIISGKVAD